MRRFGSETEYGLHLLDSSGGPITASSDYEYGRPPELRFTERLVWFIDYEFLPILEKHLKIKSTRTRGFLDNGARVYADELRNLEWCTPEAVSPRELVMYEKSADQLILSAFKRIQNLGEDSKKTDEEQGNWKISFFQLNRRSSDSMGNSRGYHENISSYQEDMYKKDNFLNFLASYSAMKNFFAGAGAVMEDGYVVSPRAVVTNELAHNSSHNEHKPLIRLKEKSCRDGMVRYQFVSSEAANDPEIVYIRHSLNEILVLCHESDISFDDLILADPVGDANKLARDLEMTNKYQLANGEKVSARQWLFRFIENVYREPKITENCSDDAFYALFLLKNKLLNCDNGREFEWQKRKLYIDGKVPDEKEVNRRITYDLSWDIIDPRGQMYEARNRLMADLFEIDLQTIERTVNSLMLLPGEDMIARIRSNLINKGIPVSSWDHYQARDGEVKLIGT